jgi:hypothetical protein
METYTPIIMPQEPHDTAESPPSSHASADWLMLGFLILALGIAAIVAAGILIAWQNG